MKRLLQRLSIACSFFVCLMVSVVIALPVHASERIGSPEVVKQSIQAEHPQVRKININSANAAELILLKGIGEKKAQAILDYRNEHGSFKSIEELSEVKGIGEAIINANREMLSIND